MYNQSGPPKIRGHAIAVHEQMTREAKRDIDSGKLIWRGSVSGIFKANGIQMGYFTHVMDLLKQTGCVDQIQQDKRNLGSCYVLLRSPGTLREDEWPSITSIVKSRKEGLTGKPPGYTMLEQDIKNLAERLPPGVDLATALAELQMQINDLRTKITELERIVAQNKS